MEETGYIELSVNGVVDGRSIKPADVDIAEVKDMITDVETFLYPTRAEKSDRPHISYKIEEGSARHLFYLPITSVILFNGLTTEIANRGNVGFLDHKRAEIISKFQRRAKERNYEINFKSSLSETSTLTISKDTKFYNVSNTFINTEMVLYGKINNEGGNNPNFHILTKEYGSLIVSATQQQLLEGEKRLYKTYGIRVSGKQSLTDGKPFDLKLLEYIDYNPVFNRSELQVLIDKASDDWSSVDDVDAWLNNLRNGTDG